MPTRNKGVNSAGAERSASGVSGPAPQLLERFTRTKDWFRVTDTTIRVSQPVTLIIALSAVVDCGMLCGRRELHPETGESRRQINSASDRPLTARAPTAADGTRPAVTCALLHSAAIKRNQALQALHRR
ncbi:hypothetical protein ACJJTC_001660 [Scirpophaga incertulas]